MAKLGKIARETLADQAAQSLLTFIEAEALMPGELLPPETQLAMDLGVSRPTIREALRSLEGRGIIEVVGGKGAVIKPPDSELVQLFFQRTMQLDHQAIVDVLELRKGIEVQNAALAAQRRTPDQLEELTGITAAMRRNLDNAEKYVELDTAFHLLIASMTDNAMIYHLVHAIREALKDTLHESLVRPRTSDLLERVQTGHERILASLEAGDVEGARQAMAAHFDEAVRTILEASRSDQ